MTTSRTVRIEGLRKSEPLDGEDENALYSLEASVLGSMPLSELWELVRARGYESPYSITNNGRILMSFSEKSIALPYDAVKVVANPTCSPNEINKDETFITHSNRQYGKPIQFDVSEQAFGDPKRPSRTIKDGRGFNVSFQRTPRMPDDNKLHQLPGTLGSYDLFNVEAYAERLPQNIRDVGGVFLPMWQREAMWVNFEMGTNQWATKYAVRVFVGRVNAVSGLLMDEDPISKDSGGQQQDYIVIPGQRWLDGICVAPGIVRQFVAMPLGSGYTVEGQKTSEEKYGGLQIEVIPELQNRLRRWSRDTNDHLKHDTAGSITIDTNHVLDEMKTPAEVGLQPGDVVRSYPLSVVYRVPCTVQDLLGDSGSPVCKVVYRRYASAFRRTRPSTTSAWTPPSAAEYEAQGVSLPKAPQTKHIPTDSIGSTPETRPAPPRESKADNRKPEVSFQPFSSKSTGKHAATEPGKKLSHQIPASSSGQPLFKHEPEGVPTEVSFATSEAPEEAFDVSLMGENQIQSSSWKKIYSSDTVLPLGQELIDLDTDLLGDSSKAKTKTKRLDKAKLFNQPPSNTNWQAAQPLQSQGYVEPTDYGGDDITPTPPTTMTTKSTPEAAPEIDEEDFILETADLKAMGLAAGGKLVQDIYKDPYPATIWNHAASRIVHVHILDPASCERVTRIVPVPPPMDVKAYAEAGGQFYVVEEQIDNHVEGGDFDNVKSVSQMDKQIGVSVEEEFDPKKPKMCVTCAIRLCDCIIRPCNHQFCNVCIKQLETSGVPDSILSRKNWKCPTCSKGVSHVAGFSAPMNLPGEEPMRMKVPVNVLEINDGRTRFKSIQKTRM